MPRRANNRKVSRTRVMGENPLDGEQLLLDALYGAPKVVPGAAAPAPAAAPPRPTKPKPQHYKIVSISLLSTRKLRSGWACS